MSKADIMLDKQLYTQVYKTMFYYNEIDELLASNTNINIKKPENKTKIWELSLAIRKYFKHHFRKTSRL